MRFSASIMLAATAGLAALTAAAAQDAPPPADQPAEAARPTKGLSDLSGTVEGLQDEPAPGGDAGRRNAARPPGSNVVPVGPDGQPLPRQNPRAASRRSARPRLRPKRPLPRRPRPGRVTSRR